MSVQDTKPGNHLLAVDLGLRCGMAMYGPDGQLRWYRSAQFAGVAQLRRAAARTLADPRLGWIISAGDVALGAIWERIAMRQGVRVQRVTASAWRATYLTLRPGDMEAEARRQIQAQARATIARSGAPVPAALVPDAAAAILIGLWGVTHLGWHRPQAAPAGTAAAAAAAPLRPRGRAANS